MNQTGKLMLIALVLEFVHSHQFIFIMRNESSKFNNESCPCSNFPSNLNPKSCQLANYFLCKQKNIGVFSVAKVYFRAIPILSVQATVTVQPNAIGFNDLKTVIN